MFEAGGCRGLYWRMVLVFAEGGGYPAWSASAKVQHAPGDRMGSAFGSLGLYGVFVGVMMALGLCGPLVLAIAAFTVMGYSNNAFKKLCSASRVVDAASWAASAR